MRGILGPTVNDGAHDLVGQTLLGRLKVLRRLGSGGMGTVYEVEHLITHHRRALKVLDPKLVASGEAVSRLVREAGVAGKTGSDAIVETFDVGRLDDGSPYVLMELLEGATVGEVLERRGRFPAPVAARIARRICEALGAAHGRGIIHRDIKPDNVFLVGGDPVEARVKLLDFGVATMLPGYHDKLTKLTQTGTAPGTPLYMAPEQMAEGAAVDARADLYAVSLVLYEMLTGRRPFTATTLVGLITQVHKGEFVPLHEAAPDVDPRLAEVVHRGMQPDPNARFPDTGAMAAALAPFEQAKPGPPQAAYSQAASPQAASPQATVPVRRRSPLVLALVLGLVAVLGIAGAVGAFLLLRGDEAPGSVGLVGADGVASAGGAEEDIAELARQGRASECLALALEAPPTARIVRLRLSCARGADDWDAYREACELQESRYPEEDPASGCRRTLSLHESGVIR